MTEIKVYTEKVDDIPLLFSFMQQMDIQRILDNIVNTHGNRQGLSVGWLTTAWLSYILSESDHRMMEVESWAEKHLETLSFLLPQPVNVKDFTDDRLADILEYLSQDRVWEEVENQLGRHLVSVYDLQGEPVRLDSTTASVYHDTEGSVLFRHGYSKDHRPDLPQFKVMLGALDPMGLPLATLLLAGNEADDGLYIPAIIRSRQILGSGGRLYVGDGKMSALDTRAFIQAGGDYYLTPLSGVGDVPELMEELLQPVWNRQVSLQLVYPGTEKEARAIALGYETTRVQQSGNQKWEERILVVYSPSVARNARRGLEQRLSRAQSAILALTPPKGRGKRQQQDLLTLKASVEAILKKNGVEGLLAVSYMKEESQRSVRGYNGQPERIEKSIRYVVEVQRDQQAISQTRRSMGWRLYATSAPQTELSFSRAVNVFHGSPRIERDFSRLKGRPLGISPLYVQREDHVFGMLRLLSLALRLLTLVEHVVRKNLQSTEEALGGLYAGNPKRETSKPTTERLLKAFGGIYLNIVQLPDETICYVTPLSALQQRILDLLGISSGIYLGIESFFNTS